MASLKGSVVVDTNVLLKLFFQENDTDKAVLLFQRMEAGMIHIVVPDLLPVEFVNILWIKLRQGASLHDCKMILTRFLDLIQRIDVVTSVALLGEILDASIEHNHPAYDMTFLVLADRLGIPFITADARLCRKMSSRSPAPMLLRDLAS